MFTPEQRAWITNYEAEERRLGLLKDDMGTTATVGSTKEFELPSPGPVVGRCYMVVDLGTQDTTFAGKPKKAHKILLGWELSELMSDGRPFSISSRYTLSLFDQALLRQHLEAWRGRPFTDEELNGFDVKNVLGAYCLLSVVHNKQGDKTYANVNGIMPVPKGMEKPAAVNANLHYEIETGDITKLPEWIQNVVKKSDEWKAKTNGILPPAPQPVKPGATHFDDMKDDIPF